MKKLFKDPLLISSIGLIVLIGIFGYLKYKPEIVPQPKIGVNTTLPEISKIEIEESQSTTLVKNNDQWQIESETNLEADEDKINELLEALEQLEISETVSQNPDNFGTYDLNQEEAVKVKLFKQDEKVFEVWIGSAGPAFNKSHFRFPNEDKVYLSTTSLRSKVIRSSWAKSSPTPTGQENNPTTPAFDQP
jgi:hypothetical protein